MKKKPRQVISKHDSHLCLLGFPSLRGDEDEVVTEEEEGVAADEGDALEFDLMNSLNWSHDCLMGAALLAGGCSGCSERLRPLPLALPLPALGCGWRAPRGERWPTTRCLAGGGCADGHGGWFSHPGAS